MISIDIPGYGLTEIHHLVTDFTGTLSEDGGLCAGVKERMNTLAGLITVHVLTADTFGSARGELEGIDCTIHVMDVPGGTLHEAKETYIHQLGPIGVFAMGNGNNDELMLKAAKVGVAVCLKEGSAGKAIRAADVLVTSAVDALDLLLHPTRLKATLRF
jgi:soluble P-type ATPase